MNHPDGVSLTSTSHPRMRWYWRVWNWLNAPFATLSPDSLETVEMDIQGIQEEDLRWLNGISDFELRRENLLNTARTNMSDIEKEIQAKGLTAPRITLADIETLIASAFYLHGKEIGATSWYGFGPANITAQQVETALSCLTLCVLVLKNGFTVTGESACASPANFNAEVGRKIARQKAIEKCWPLLGYALKERLSQRE